MKKYKNKLKNVLVFLSEREIAQVFEAVDFAERMHAGQTRVGGEEYIYHLLRVAIATAKYFAKYDRQNVVVATIAAVLHDSVEDTEATLEEICEKFGSEVAKLVASLSHSANPDGTVNDDEPDEVYLARVASGGEVAINVKQFDILDNIASLKDAPEQFRKEKVAGHQLRNHLWEKINPAVAKNIRNALEKIK